MSRRGGFRELRVPLLGVPVIRVIYYGDLYGGPPVLGNYHLPMGLRSSAQVQPPNAKPFPIAAAKSFLATRKHVLERNRQALSRLHSLRPAHTTQQLSAVRFNAMLPRVRYTSSCQSRLNASPENLHTTCPHARTLQPKKASR